MNRFNNYNQEYNQNPQSNRNRFRKRSRYFQSQQYTDNVNTGNRMERSMEIEKETEKEENYVEGLWRNSKKQIKSNDFKRLRDYFGNEQSLFSPNFPKWNPQRGSSFVKGTYSPDEFLYNFGILLELTEREAEGIKRNEKQNNFDRGSKREQLSEFIKRSQLLKEDNKSLNEVSDLIGSCEKTLGNVELDLQRLAKVFEKLQEEYYSIYITHQLVEIFVPLGLPLFKSYFKDWDPLKGNTNGNKEKRDNNNLKHFQIISTWKGLLLANKLTIENCITKENEKLKKIGYNGKIQSLQKNEIKKFQKVKNKGKLIFERLINDIILPKMESVFTFTSNSNSNINTNYFNFKNEKKLWDVKSIQIREELLNFWFQHFSESIKQLFCKEILFPNLKIIISEWSMNNNTNNHDRNHDQNHNRNHDQNKQKKEKKKKNERNDGNSKDIELNGKLLLHEYIGPFLQYLSPLEISTLVIPIRRKLGKQIASVKSLTINEWEMISPWKTVFPQKEWNKLIFSYVIPKLKRRLLEQKFTITNFNNLNNFFLPLKSVLNWLHRGVNKKFLTQILIDIFFPQWHESLFKLITSNDVTKSKSKPKTKLKSGSGSGQDLDLLELDFNHILNWYLIWKPYFVDFIQLPEINIQFNFGLEMINRKIEGKDVFVFYHQKGKRLLIHQEEQLLRQELEQQQRKRNRQMKRSLTFKEVVQIFAEDNEILLMPLNFSQNGKQVFSFGRCQIYLQNEIAFVRKNSNSNVWDPISLDELLQLNNVYK
ncbi:tuftelin-interacting protein [Anaeramoeba flamelloides]|uniref:Tuftelin-interacting protein n=1 Tax=Anaeramoeba flamelloides TaxID=1746091 RepID=A0ABQ8YBZ6_9EUKA|nr:tuftelin-interacting protein [Anaeramoeba flamelloides]